MTYDALRELGIDTDTVKWRDLSLCEDRESIRTNMFFDEYEQSETVAKMIDELCLSCPVMVQCMAAGVENNEYGVWGGIFLNSGKPDENRNSHKAPETWDEIRERLGSAESDF